MPAPTDSQVLIEVAEIKKDVRHLTHGQSNLEAKFDALVKKIDDSGVTRREHDAQGVRITKVEDNQSWAMKLIGATWIAMILGAIGFKAYSGH